MIRALPALALVAASALPACLVDVPDLRDAAPPTTQGVSVAAPDGRAYLIDATEVTNRDYAAWLETLGGAVPAQPAGCESNTDLVPRSAWPAPAARALHPVTFVDWCDAWTYCSANDKRLCGGANGASYDPDVAADATRSEWFNACSAGGKQRFPYGSTYDGHACNGAGYGLLESTPVTEPASCEGGFAGLFGMNGNAREWDGACVDDSPGAGCLFRGGGFKSNEPSDDPATPGDMACDVAWLLGRLEADELTGIRCCADPR